MNRPPSSFPLSVPGLRLSRLLACALLLVAVATGNLRAGTVADLDRDNGLPDAKLGAPLASFGGLTKTEDTGRWLSFKRPADKLRYNNIPVTGITYNFFKDRLYSINLDLSGKGNVKSLIKLLEREYGKEHTMDTLPLAKTTTTLDVREWSGTRVYCVLKSGSDNDGGVLTLLDKPTWDALQLPKKERLEASKQMLGGSFLDGTLDPKPKAEPAQGPAGPDGPAAQAPSPLLPNQSAPNPLLPPPPQ